MFLNIVRAERARGGTLTLEHVITTRNGSWTVMDGGCYSSNPPGVPRYTRISIADLRLQGTGVPGPWRANPRPHTHTHPTG